MVVSDRLSVHWLRLVTKERNAGALRYLDRSKQFELKIKKTAKGLEYARVPVTRHPGTVIPGQGRRPSLRDLQKVHLCESKFQDYLYSFAIKMIFEGYALLPVSGTDS